MSGEWIDISRPVSAETPVWPGDTPWAFDWAWAVSEGASVNVGALGGSTHTGTHADAPRHLDITAAPIEALPLEAFLGPAAVVDLTAGSGAAGAVAPITAADLAARGHGGARRLLLRTGCDWRDGFPTAFRGLSPDAAAWCVAEGLVLVGTDAPSVDPFDSTSLEAHHVLMAGGIAVLESLALEGVEAGAYELAALPLRLLGADASPVRAVLRPLPPGGHADA